MLRDFHVTHRHPDFRMPEDLLQNRDIGPGQNGSGGKCVTQVVEVHGPAQYQVVADAIMGFADRAKMGTGLPGTRKNPVVVWSFLPTFLQKFENLLAHNASRSEARMKQVINPPAFGAKPMLNAPAAGSNDIAVAFLRISSA